MRSDIFFLAEYAEGAPSRSAIELATGAADLAKESGGDAVALAYGPGAADAAGLGTYGAKRAMVLGDEDRPAISFAASAVAAVRDGRPLALLAPATPNGRDLAAALVGSLDLPAFGPVRSVELVDGRVRSEQATLQGSVITTSEPAEGVEGPAVLLVLPSTFSPEERGGTAQLIRPSTVDDSAFAKVSVVERHPAEARVANLEEASVIIAGGRGVGGEAGFELLQQLADVLDGTVGASRAAADAGWVP
jgi:electron transfer flavoprotein alpha subunit